MKTEEINLGRWENGLLNIPEDRENKEKVFYSDLVIEELSKDFDEIDIKKIFKIVSDEGLLEKTGIKEGQVREAAKLCKALGIPFGDGLHAILARDKGAIMVTRDKHFELLRHMVEVKKPEELI